MFLRKLQANVSNHAVTLLLIDWYQYHPLLLFDCLRSKEQSHALSGSDLPYHFVGFPPHSTSPIPWAEHLLLLRWCLSSYNSDTASTWCVCGTQKVRGTFWGL